MSGRTRKTFIDSKTAHTENNLFVRVCEQHVSCQKLSKKSGKNFSNNNKLFPNALSLLSRYRLFERNVKSVGEGEDYHVGAAIKLNYSHKNTPFLH